MIPLAFPTLVQQAEPLVFATFGIAESHILYKPRDIDLPEHAFHATRRGNWLTLYPTAINVQSCKRSSPKELVSTSLTLEARNALWLKSLREQLWTREEMIATAESCTAENSLLVYLHFWFFWILSRRRHRLLQ